MFVTLEDETGTANLVVFPSIYENQRRDTLTARLMMCRGKVQKVDGVIHVIAERVTSLNAWLEGLGGGGGEGAGGGRGAVEGRGGGGCAERAARCGDRGRARWWGGGVVCGAGAVFSLDEDSVPELVPSGYVSAPWIPRSSICQPQPLAILFKGH